MPALTYPQVLNEWDRSRAFGDTRDIKTFAQDMNTRTGSQDYNEGLRDGWWTRASARLDQASAMSPLGQIAQGISDSGHPLLGGVASGMVKDLPYFALGGVPGVGIPAMAGGMAAHTYAETGSPAQAFITGAAGLAMPAASHLLGGVGEDVAGGVGRFVGSQVGMIGVGQTAQMASDLAAKQKYDPTDPHFWAQQIPFTVFDALHLATAPKAETPIAPSATPAPETPTQPQEVGYKPPSGSTVAKAQVEQLLGRFTAAVKDPQATPPALSELLKSVTDTVNQPPETQAQNLSLSTDQGLSLEGWARKAGSSWKMLVKDQQGQTVDLPDHKNVWINSTTEPQFNPASGTYIWKGQKSEVNTNVTQPIVQEDQGALSKEPGLPMQPQGVTSTQPLAPDVARHATEMLPDIPPEIMQHVNGALASESVTQHEQAISVEDSARSAAVAPLDRAEVIPTLVATDPKATIQSELHNGATETQAVETARLQAQTPKVDEAMTVQQAALRGLLSSLEKPEDLTPEQEAEWNRVANKGPFPVKADYKGQGSLSWSGRLEGSPRFQTEPEALEWLHNYQREHPEDQEDWDIHNRGIGEADQGRYVISKQIGKQSVEEAGTVPAAQESTTQAEEEEREKESEPEIAADSVQERPATSIDTVLRHLEVAGQAPRAFASATNMEIPDALELIRKGKVMLPLFGKGITDVDMINDALDKVGLDGFSGPRDMQNAMRQLSTGVDEYRKMSNFTLGSTTPRDEGLFNEMSWEKGPRHVLNWLLSQPADKYTGGVRSLVSDMLKALPEASDPTMTFPGHPDWDGSKGSWYSNRNINIGALPSRPEEAIPAALTVAHEMGHHATRELANQDTPEAKQFRSTLEEVRKAAVQVLPKGLRQIVEKSRAAGLMDQYRRGMLSYSEMQNKWEEMGGKQGKKLVAGQGDLIYGLHNTDELLAQAFSSPAMVEHLANTQMPSPVQKTLLQRFTESWTKLFKGSVTSSSGLSHLMQGFDNYLGSQGTYNGRSYMRDVLVNQYGVRPEGLASRLQSVEQLFNTGKLDGSLAGYQREQQYGLLPVSNTQDGQLHPAVEADLTTGKPEDVHESTMSLLAGDLPYHQDLLYRLQQDVRLAQDLRQKISSGQLPGSLPDVEDNLRLASANVNSMSKAMDKQILALQRWTSLNSMTPEGFDQAQVGSLIGKKFPNPPDPTGLEDMARQLVGLQEPKLMAPGANKDELEGKGVNWLWRNFALTTFLKKQVPEFRAVADHASQAQADTMVRENELRLALGWNSKTQSFDKGLVDNYIKVMQDPRLNPITSDVLRLVQQKEQQGQQWNLTDPAIQKLMGGLSAKMRDGVTSVINQIQSRYSHWSQNIIPNANAQLNKEYTASAIMSSEPGMVPQDARLLSTQLYQAIAGLKNPTQAPASIAALTSLSSKMTPDTFIKALQLSQGLADAAAKNEAFLQSRPTYVTEQRFGDHQIVMLRQDGSQYRASFKTRDAALQAVQQKEKQGYTYVDYVPKQDANVKGGGVSKDVLNSMRELDQQASNLLQQYAGGNPQLLDKLLPLTQRVNDYQASMAAFNPIPGTATPRRRFVGGREEINMLENDNLFYGKANNYLRHKLLSATTDVDMMDPNLRQNRQALQMAQQHVENQLTPDNPLVSKINEATYFKNLSWNIGVNMLHAVQSLTTGMTSLISETGGVGDAFKLTIGAQKATLARVMGKQVDPETQWVWDKIASEGGLGIVSHDDFTDHDRDNFYNLARAQGMVGKTLNTVQGAARGWSNIFAKFNDMVGMKAGFDLGRHRGMNREDAYQFAKSMKEQGYYSGGKAQRPVGLWSIKTKAVPQLLSSLQTYSLGWFSQLADNWKTGFGEAPTGSTYTQRLGAKKAFLYQLGAQAVMAGAMGLPGVGQGLALLKQTTGFDTKDWLKQNLSGMFGEDKQNGGLMTMLALHGAVAGFTPLDPSGRHIPNVPFIGVQPKNGFQLDNLIPAPFTTASDVVKGLIAAAQGKPEEGLSALPHVLQGPLQLAMGDGDVKDKYGTYQLTPSERFIQALGMESSRVTEARDTAKMVADNARVEEDRQQAMASQIESLLQSGDSTGAQQKLAEFRQNNPGLDMQQFLHRVISGVAAKSAPAHVYDTNSMPIPYFNARRSAIENATSALGLPMHQNPIGGLLASQEDEQMTQNPYWSAAQDRAAALSGLAAPRPSIGLWPVASQLPFQAGLHPW